MYLSLVRQLLIAFGCLSRVHDDSLDCFAVHMKWQSRRSVPAPLSQALIQYLLLLLPILMHRYNESKNKALASLHKACSVSKAQVQDPQEPDSYKGPGGPFEGLKTLPNSVNTDKHGSRVMMEAPMQARVDTFDRTKALIGEYAKCCLRDLVAHDLS